MASGILGTPSNLAINTDTSIYTVPPDTFSVVTVSICNRSANTVSVRLAISTSSTPGLADFLEYGTQILANGVLERSGIVLQAGRQVIVRSSAVDVNAIVTGIETSTT
jgi:hypothetical protein